MCYDNQSYHYVQIHGSCFWLAFRMGFFLFWSFIVIRLCVLKLEAMILELFPKHVLWSKLLFFPRYCHEILKIISFHCFAQIEMIFLRSFWCKNYCVCKVNGSVIRVVPYQIHVVHGCFNDWYIFQFIFDGFYWTWSWII